MMALANISTEEKRRLMLEILEGPHISSNNKHCLLYGFKNSNRNRYPTVQTSNGSVDAHRVVYYGHHTSQIPNSAIQISHRCHNKRCVRIDHLVAECQSNNQLRNACFKLSKKNKSQSKKSSLTEGCLRHTGPPCIFVCT